jgi:hypothetical protein
MARGKDQNGWCILRTAGQRTLILAKSLTDAGFDAWTPAETRKHKLRGGKTGEAEKTMALMPTFVFVRCRHLPELHSISTSPSSPHPAFSLFRYLGQFPILADREVERLREIEHRHLPKGQRITMPIGATVRPKEGPYTGMSGIVEASKNGATMVFFGGWMKVKIDTFILERTDIEQMQPISGTAALAA